MPCGLPGARARPLAASSPATWEAGWAGHDCWPRRPRHGGPARHGTHRAPAARVGAFGLTRGGGAFDARSSRAAAARKARTPRDGHTVAGRADRLCISEPAAGGVAVRLRRVGAPNGRGEPAGARVLLEQAVVYVVLLKLLASRHAPFFATAHGSAGGGAARGRHPCSAATPPPSRSSTSSSR